MENLLQLSVNLEQRGVACYSFKSEAVLKPSLVMVFVLPFLHVRAECAHAPELEVAKQ